MKLRLLLGCDRPFAWCIACGRWRTLLLRVNGRWACWRHVRLVGRL